MDGKRNIKLWIMCLHISHIIFLFTIYWLWRRWGKVDIMFLWNGKIKNYRGRTAEKYDNLKDEIIENPIYKEHNIEYLSGYIENLRNKGIYLKV